jgi:hypothetical protein
MFTDISMETVNFHSIELYLLADHLLQISPHHLRLINKEVLRVNCSGYSKHPQRERSYLFYYMIIKCTRVSILSQSPHTQDPQSLSIYDVLDTLPSAHCVSSCCI